MKSSAVIVSDEVRKALAAGKPVVALESAVLTHGLPRETWAELARRYPAMGTVPAWLDAELPINLAAVEAMSAAVRSEGAIPAVTGMIDGALRAGLESKELRALAQDVSAVKLSSRDLAIGTALHRSGGTTVAATLVICRAAGLRVFATGGIGGVHRNWQKTFDISADLLALSRHAVCVVSSGAKSILDLPATLEALDTLSIPLVGFRCDGLPRFVSAPDPGLPIPCRVEDEATLAQICSDHWSLGGGAVLVANPIEPKEALSPDILERALEESFTASSAARDARDTHSAPRSGPGATPALLAALAERSGGRTLRANLFVLHGNAGIAARIARAMAQTHGT